MWVRLWVKSNCASGINSTEEKYEWFDKRPSDYTLKCYAEDFVDQTGYGNSERDCKYGFDRLKKLPVKAKRILIGMYEQEILHANHMLKILGNKK